MSQKYRLGRRKHERAGHTVGSEPALSHNISRFGTTAAQQSDWGNTTVHLPKGFGEISVAEVTNMGARDKKTIRNLLGQVAGMESHNRTAALAHPIVRAVLAAAQRLNIDLPRQLA